MATEWINPKGEMISIVQETIDNDMTFLKEYRIGVIAWEGRKKTKGKRVLGTCSLVDDKTKFLLSQFGDDEAYDALIAFDADWWINEAKPNQRRALALHELCHLSIGKNGLEIIGHDIEEFNIVIRRYGYWLGDVEETARAFQHRMELGDKVSF